MNRQQPCFHRRLALAAFSMFIGAAAFGQTEPVTLDVKDMPVRDILSLIEKKSTYTFAYSDTDLPVNRKFSIQAVDRPIAEVLHQMLPGAAIHVEENKIILSQASKSHSKEETAQKQAKDSWQLTGTVVDENGEPLIGASVVAGASRSGIATDIDGKFTLTVHGKNPTVTVSYVGYTTKNIKAERGRSLRVALEPSSEVLGDVVVTALGITREQKSLGYAVTRVSSDELTNSVSGNWLNALDGKVAGMSTTGAGTGPTGSMRVVLRGDQSLNYGSNEALFVVDGVPVNTGDPGTGSGGGYSNSDAPVDFGNGASEINPEDVESVSVLKGPAATALYGSRAANGAIVITTKSGRDTKGVGVTLNSSVTFERAGFWPDFQKEYGPGNDNGFLDFACWNFSKDNPEGFGQPRNASRYSFGEKYDASKLRNQFNSYNWETGEYTLTPFVYADDWYTGIFRTGTTFKNNVTISSNNGKGTSARLSITDTHNEWILPNTGYSNQSVSLSFSTKMNKWIKLTSKVNYLHKASDNLPISGYNNNNPLYYILWGTTNNSMQLYKDEYFSGRANKENYEGGCKDGKGMVNSLGNSQPGNPYQQLYEATNSINKDRVYGNVAITVTFPVKGLTLDLRAGTDISVDFRQQKKPFRTPSYKSGFYREQNNRDIETNIDFMLKYRNNRLFDKRLDINAAFGGNNMERRVYRNSTTLSKLGEEGVYNTSNTPTGENPRIYNWRSKKIVNSFYGFVNLSWDNTYFLDITARNDWSSALSRHNWSFFYPSVSGSVLLDQLLKLDSSRFNMLKLRASWANVGNDTSPYTLTDAYSPSGTYPGSYSLPSSMSNYYIKPENVESWEAGIETRFFMNRIGLDVAYYDSRTTNQIVSAVTDPIIGYSSKKINAGEIRNRGIEIALHGVPVQTRDFTWSVDVNWSRNWNKLVSLENGWDPRVPFQQASNIAGKYVHFYSFVGEEMGWLYGRGYQRAPEGAYYLDSDGNKVDCSGMKLVDANTGHPVLDEAADRRLGKINPTWRGGLSMNVRYKNISVSMNFTAQMGGHAYSMTHAILAYQGKLTNSLPGRVDGLVVEGVNAITAADGSISYQPNTTVTETINKYYNGYVFPRDNAEENIFKTDFLKFKELRVDYSLPRRVCRKTKVLQSASLGAYATNLFCLTSFPLYDPEAGAMVGTNVYSGLEAGAMPMTRTYGINLKLSF